MIFFIQDKTTKTTYLTRDINEYYRLYELFTDLPWYEKQQLNIKQLKEFLKKNNIATTPRSGQNNRYLTGAIRNISVFNRWRYGATHIRNNKVTIIEPYTATENIQEDISKIKISDLKKEIIKYGKILKKLSNEKRYKKLNNKILKNLIEMTNRYHEKHQDAKIWIKNIYSINERWLTLNKKSRKRILKYLNGEIKTYNYTSTVEIFKRFHQAIEVEIIFGKNKKITDNGGEYFKYYNTSDIDLNRYQIYKKFNKKVNEEHCIIFALKKLNINTEKLIEILIENRELPKNKLKYIAEAINKNITLWHYNVDYYKTRKKSYIIDKKLPYIKLALYRGHYFIFEQTQYTVYSIKNYRKINKEKNWQNISGAQYIKGKQYFIRKKQINKASSLQLIKFLYDDNYFKLIDNIRENLYSKAKDKIINLSGIYRKIVKKSSKKSKKKILFADIETYTAKNYKLVEFMICSTIFSLNAAHVKSFSKIISWLNYITDYKEKTPLLIYFHNLKFDISFIISKVHKVIKTIEKDNQIYELVCTHNHKKIYFRDSYKLISAPLSSFGNMFELETHKTVFPYDYYNEENINNKIGKTNEAIKYIKKEERDQFLANIKLINSLNSFEYFDTIKYSEFYCEKDVKVLAKGVMKFAGMCSTELGMDSYDILSASSLAHKYMIKNRVYNDVYELSGSIRRFIQKAVHGGRVATLNNETHDINKPVNDFDAVSLYPSAMERLGGFLRGTPKVFEINSLIMKLNDLTEPIKINDDVSGYFIEIIVTKVGIKRGIPILSYTSDAGIKIYTNKPQNKKIVVDKITLEDLCKFQKITYNYIRGVYFNQGRNKNIKKIINNLFEERKKYKKKKNLIEQIYKLIMNSAYGKTIIKPSKDTTKFANSKKEIEAIKNKQYNQIKEMVKIRDDLAKFTLYSSIVKHYNIPQVGVEVLSMSKRIMNEVMYLAEDNGIKIYYQDTDSIHIEDDKVQQLAILYKEKYNKVLIGTNLGQFHNDFSTPSKLKNLGYVPLYSVRCIIAGKKTYLDKVIYCKKDGKIYDKLVEVDKFIPNTKTTPFYYHIRAKGIPTKGIILKAKEKNISIEEFYKLLFKEIIEIDLTKCRFCLERIGYDTFKNISFNRTMDYTSKTTKTTNTIMSTTNTTNTT